MSEFVFDIGEQARAAARLIGTVHRQLAAAFEQAKKAVGISQQSIAQKLGVHRSVVNRQLKGDENLTLRSVAELAWAMDHDVFVTIVPRASVARAQYKIQALDNVVVMYTIGTSERTNFHSFQSRRLIYSASPTTNAIMTLSLTEGPLLHA